VTHQVYPVSCQAFTGAQLVAVKLSVGGFNLSFGAPSSAKTILFRQATSSCSSCLTSPHDSNQMNNPPNENSHRQKNSHHGKEYPNNLG
jgi:hypothetical protein